MQRVKFLVHGDLRWLNPEPWSAVSILKAEWGGGAVGWSEEQKATIQ